MGIAYVLVNCEIGHEKVIISSLSKLCEIQGTYGIYDFICKVSFDEMGSFEEILVKIRAIHNITHTNTIHIIPDQSL